MTLADTKISKGAMALEFLVFTRAREAYDIYAGLDGDPKEAGLPDIQCTQVNLIRWEIKNFGLQSYDRSAWGIVEELGEMLDAIAEGTEADVEDAIADVLIFLTNLCTKLRLDVDALFQHAIAHVGALSGLDALTMLWRDLGKLGHVVLKSEQGIRHYGDVEVRRRDMCIVLTRIVSHVYSLAFSNGKDAQLLMMMTADEVMKRDWVAYPDTGLPPVEEEPDTLETDTNDVEQQVQ